MAPLLTYGQSIKLIMDIISEKKLFSEKEVNILTVNEIEQ